MYFSLKKASLQMEARIPYERAATRTTSNKADDAFDISTSTNLSFPCTNVFVYIHSLLCILYIYTTGL